MLQSQGIAFFRSLCLRCRVFKFVSRVRNRTQSPLRKKECTRFRVFFLSQHRKRLSAGFGARPGA
jgi:hypothetical protein